MYIYRLFEALVENDVDDARLAGAAGQPLDDIFDEDFVDPLMLGGAELAGGGDANDGVFAAAGNEDMRRLTGGDGRNLASHDSNPSCRRRGAVMIRMVPASTLSGGKARGVGAMPCGSMTIGYQLLAKNG